MSNDDTDQPIERLINNIGNHQNVAKTLTQLRALLQQRINKELKQENDCITTPFDLGILMAFVMGDLLLITNQFDDKNHYDNIKNHLSFMRFLVISYSSSFDLNMKQLKELFDICIIKCSNDIQCWNTLGLFEVFWKNFYIRSQLKKFYLEYMEPLMNNYIANKNYLMISKLYHCFCEYYSKQYNINVTKSKNRCISFLELNTNTEEVITVAINRLNEVVSLNSGLPCMCLLTMLCDIVTVTSEAKRTPLFKLNSAKKQLSNKTESVLTEIYNIFASNKDGTMNKTDMARYIIACGADSASSSIWRINHIFSMYGVGNPNYNLEYVSPQEFSGKFIANSFCEFYRAAALDRTEYVWQDISIYGFNYKLECAFIDYTNENEHKEDDIRSVQDLVSKNDVYDKMLVQLLKQIENEFDENISEKILPLIIRLPKSYMMQQRIYDLNASFDVLLGSNNIHCMVYNLIILNGICNDKNVSDEWKRLFLKKKGFDHLIRMLIEFYCTWMDEEGVGSTQSYQLGIAMLVKVMYHFCSFNQTKCIPVYQFLHNIMQYNEYDLYLMNDYVRDVPQNNLVHLICCIAKMDDKNENVGFLNGIPPHIVQLHIDPLIMGYVAQCNISRNVPNDIIKLLMCFFF